MSAYSPKKLILELRKKLLAERDKPTPSPTLNFKQLLNEQKAAPAPILYYRKDLVPAPKAPVVTTNSYIDGNYQVLEMRIS